MITSQTRAASRADWTKDDYAILESVEPSRADGLALKRWWERVDSGGLYAEQFELTRSFNQSARSYGFFDESMLEDRRIPVMGLVEEAHYDYAKDTAGPRASDELRE